ncbi:MAG: DUF1338 domain-containing protein [Alphaproteobacteria bacterium]
MNGIDILNAMLTHMWTHYKTRVPYASTYETMVEVRGGKVQNDHLAFRTFNCPVGAQPKGVLGISRIFTALGYVQKDCYIFTDKKLTAWHYEHQLDPRQPKIFISQLEVDALTPPTAAAIKQATANGRDALTLAQQNALAELAEGNSISPTIGKNLALDLAQFFTRPWTPPPRAIVEAVDKESQYAAWTLLHGNSVNHFTAYINFQNVREWPDLEATARGLSAVGVPMKTEYEGERGSKLRQTSTKAAMEDCAVTEADGTPGTINWSYAYYELAERGRVRGQDGEPELFQGFLGEQATNLFEMTKTAPKR